MGDPIERLGLRAQNLLRELGVTRLEQIPELTPAKILTRPAGTEAVFQEIQALLAEHGLAFGKPAPAAPAEAPERTWGCLHARGDFADVRGEVIAAYGRAGFAEAARGESEETIPDLRMNPSPALGPDEVVVLDEGDGWISIASRRHEWAPPGRHPLALAMSIEVVSATSVAHRYAEVSVYAGGKLVGMSVAGPDAPETGLARPAELPHLDVLRDPERFAAQTGWSQFGHRDFFEGAPLDDLAPEEFLVFRVKKKRGRK